MWLATTIIGALVFTTLRIFFKNKFKFGLISLMLWGGAIMIFVDHLLGYTGGVFMEAETDGLIRNGVMLGLAMMIPVLLIWIMALTRAKLKSVRDK